MTERNWADDFDHFITSEPAHGDMLDERHRARHVLHEEFSDFYRTTIRRLVSFLLSLGASLSTASEVAQESMIKAYLRWDEIQKPQAWVYKVASRELVRKIADIREELVEQVPEPTSLLPRPDAFEEWEVQQEMLRMLMDLPQRQRQILAWTLNGYAPTEIAEQLRLTPDSVRASLMKARRAAAGYIEDREGER